MSKYACLTNKHLSKKFSGGYYEISFRLPVWFRDWNKSKIIKVYGCSFNYLDSENKKPILSTLYQNQFISVHSNISYKDTYPLNSDYLTKEMEELKKIPQILKTNLN
jgi:hypothetical protein